MRAARHWPLLAAPSRALSGKQTRARATAAAARTDHRTTPHTTHVEKVVTGHTRLTGNTGRDDNDLGTLERLGKTIVSGEVALNNGRGVDVRNVGSNTWGVDTVCGSTSITRA